MTNAETFISSLNSDAADLAINARDWFRNLRDQITAKLEDIEAAGSDGLYQNFDFTNQKFDIKSWDKAALDHKNNPSQPAAEIGSRGGGEMGMLRGKVFEKAGVHFSCVFGAFSEDFRAQIPGAAEDPRFFATGISVIIHPRNPNMPAAHMNTRMLVTQNQWFGGGGDLNPMLPRYRQREHQDSRDFHQKFKNICANFDQADHQEYADWCDRYFHLPHRNENRGIGGIFYDRLNSGDVQSDFNFTKAVGVGFKDIYAELAMRNLEKPWTAEDTEAQSHQRGRYAEFNLLYDRGTQFGLKTGGNVESILSSLPPIASWK